MRSTYRADLPHPNRRRVALSVAIALVSLAGTLIVGINGSGANLGHPAPPPMGAGAVAAVGGSAGPRAPTPPPLPSHPLLGSGPFDAPRHQPLLPPDLGRGPGAPYSASTHVSPSRCFGLAPPYGQQAAYLNGCYGHDEPGVEFYSNQPGSGGNVSWNVTLPVDAGPSALQSYLYAAVWFGLTLQDPQGWMNQCFLELQLYPDSSWDSASSVPGNWVALAVAWQINPATGYEDPCFYSPMLDASSSDGYLNMAQGDRVQVVLSGWAGSTHGEQVGITDLTSGAKSSIALIDPNGSIPLDPAYSTSSWPNSLQWTPGGELPVSFAFEIGHTSDPSAPENSSYGGCSPGVPPPTPIDPAVPCPSYNPASWANDTAQPWEIQPPKFFNATVQTPAVQGEFSQDLGGANAVVSLSNGACLGRIGSAHCSYPWYSYSCTAHAFEFGAVDYAGVTNDFGQMNEYTTANVSNGLGIPYYPPAGFSVPSCAAPNGTLDLAISGSGSVTLLGHAYSSAANLSGLLFGAYSVEAGPASGSAFLRWTISGSSTVDLPESPSATLLLGDGTTTLTADFGASSTSREVWFNDSASAGSVQLYRGGLYGPGTLVGTLSSGTSESLAPGLYGIQADPPPGENFTGFLATGSGLEMAAPGYPYTWFLITSPGGTAAVEATSQSTAVGAELNVTVAGRGAVGLGTHRLTNTGGPEAHALWSTPVGSFLANATPAPGWSFVGWSNGGSLVQSDYMNATNLTFEMGESYLTAIFGAEVRVLVQAPSSGRIVIGPSAPLANDSQIDLAPGTYRLDALPFDGETFVNWTDTNRSALWVRGPGAHPRIVVNASGTIEVTFTASPPNTVTFGVEPTGAGIIRFNDLVNYTASAAAPTTNSSVAAGTFLLAEYPGGDYRFVGWNLSGALTLATGGLLVVSGAGAVVAQFVEKSYPITFVSTPGGMATATIGGVALANDQTAYFNNSRYVLTAQVPANQTFLRWSTSLSVAAPKSPSTFLTVNAPGTVTELVLPFLLAAPTASYPVVDVGVPIALSVNLTGAVGAQYVWEGLPNGCSTLDSVDLSCTPTAPGTFFVRVSVSLGGGFAALTPSLQLSVVNPPSIPQFTWTPQPSEPGAPTVFSVTVAGGVGPFAYSYSGLPGTCAPPDAPTFTCTPDAVSSYAVTASVTDAFGKSATSAVTWDVQPGPTITSFAAVRSELTVGAATQLSTDPHGGVAPYSYLYSGLPGGCVSRSTPNLTCVPQVAGLFTVQVTVVDSVQGSTNASLQLLVNGAPLISNFVVSPTDVLLGQSVNFSLAASGGTGRLAFGFSGLPTGCSAGDVSHFTCEPTSAGVYLVTAFATDRDGISGNSTIQLIVTPPPPPTTSPQGPAPPGPSPLLYGALIAGVALAAVLLIALYWRRLRSGRPPRTGPPGTRGSGL